MQLIFTSCVKQEIVTLGNSSQMIDTFFYSVSVFHFHRAASRLAAMPARSRQYTELSTQCSELAFCL